MSTSCKNILLIGGDSQIARSLAAWHQSRGDRVVTTSRRAPTSSCLIGLDLGSFSENQIPDGFEIAYLCGSVTSLQFCESQPERSTAVNVTGTLRAMRTLAARGTFSVFFSSNLVFDGNRPHMNAEASPNPKCEYGRQKVAVETAIRRENLPVAILRLTKVLTPTSTLLGSWIDSLSRGAAIKPFSDMPMAPVTIGAVVAAATEVSQTQQTGIRQISASHDITYSEAAAYIAAQLGVPTDLVRPIPSREVLGPSLHVPRHTSLKPTRSNSIPGNGEEPLIAIQNFLETMGRPQPDHRVS